MTALEPRLTPLDEKVRAQLRSDKGQRARAIARSVDPQRRSWGHKTPPQLVADVRLILRGFEHLGKATQRGGWWRAT